MKLVSHPCRSNVLSSVSSLCFFHLFSSPRFPWGMLRFSCLCIVSDLTVFGPAYPIQVYSYTPIRIDRSGFSAQCHYSAEDAHGLIGEGVEVFGVDAGGGFGHGKWSSRERMRKAVNLRVLNVGRFEGCKGVKEL